MRKYIFVLSVLAVAVFLIFGGRSASAVKPSDFGLKDGDLISAMFSDDPDVYIVNEHGYKRLFLNPEIFKFYAHLGGFANVKLVTPQVRDAFTTSGYFRNCETNDPRVFGVDVVAEDTAQLRWVDTPGERAVQDDPDFFKKTFCINRTEFAWYKQGQAYDSVLEVPAYTRRLLPTPTSSPTPTPIYPTPTPTPTPMPTASVHIAMDTFTPPVQQVTMGSSAEIGRMYIRVGNNTESIRLMYMQTTFVMLPGTQVVNPLSRIFLSDDRGVLLAEGTQIPSPYPGTRWRFTMRTDSLIIPTNSTKVLRVTADFLSYNQNPNGAGSKYHLSIREYSDVGAVGEKSNAPASVIGTFPINANIQTVVPPLPTTPTPTPTPQGGIRVDRPVAGNTVTLGDPAYTIAWTTLVSPPFSPVDIMLVKRSFGSGGVFYIAKGVQNQGWYNWDTTKPVTRPDGSAQDLRYITGNDFFIHMSMPGTSAWGESGTFSIVSVNPTPTPIPTWTPTPTPAPTPNYDACRLDKLDGSNITRNAFTDQTECLSRLCDIYGPANTTAPNYLTSVCKFMETEIKRYTPGSVAGAFSATWNRMLGIGLVGEDVKLLQQILVQRGLLTANAVTGYFGKLTQAAVKDLQWQNNIISTGFFGPVTRALLQETQ